MKKTSTVVQNEVFTHLEKKRQLAIDEKIAKFEEKKEEYNSQINRAKSAPVPPIAVHYNEVVLKAVPVEITTASGIILGIGDAFNDIEDTKTLDAMSHRVDFFQEILMVGPLVSDQEKEAGLRPGRIARIKWDRFRTIDDDHTPGIIQMSIAVPQEIVNGYPYLIVDKRDIMYTKDAE